MPIYEYECSGCDRVIEVQQRISDSPLQVCPDCGGNVKKLVSVSSFQLKGGGWYADGYSSSSNSTKSSDTPTKDKKSTPTPPCKSDKTECKNCPAATT